MRGRSLIPLAPVIVHVHYRRRDMICAQHTGSVGPRTVKVGGLARAVVSSQAGLKGLRLACTFFSHAVIGQASRGHSLTRGGWDSERGTERLISASTPAGLPKTPSGAPPYPNGEPAYFSPRKVCEGLSGTRRGVTTSAHLSLDRAPTPASRPPRAGAFAGGPPASCSRGSNYGAAWALSWPRAPRRMPRQGGRPAGGAAPVKLHWDQRASARPSGRTWFTRLSASRRA